MTKASLKYLCSYLSDIKFITEDFPKRVFYVLRGHLTCCYLVVVIVALIEEHVALVRRDYRVCGGYGLVVCRVVKSNIYPPPYRFVPSELVCSLCCCCGLDFENDSICLWLASVVLFVLCYQFIVEPYIRVTLFDTLHCWL